ncbi:hypothetical protein CXB51_018417 [Gossypium anomalum]|uniref:Photosystem II PsbX n=1 Tax=Gossypium anomalum TaxID=47600 RepID=A0A8J5YCI3_9ROSI|nr:hypothetical protein CXB51_018417 [Gossypium anomalum]
MASTSAVSMALPLSPTTQTKVSIPNPFLNPLPLKHSSMAATPTTRPNATKLEIKATSSSSSNKEKAVTILTAAAMTTSMMVPEIAQAADGVTPSLKNFLLSIAAGGVVLVAIIGAVIGVSNFDPVKRS